MRPSPANAERPTAAAGSATRRNFTWCRPRRRRRPRNGPTRERVAWLAGLPRRPLTWALVIALTLLAGFGISRLRIDDDLR